MFHGHSPNLKSLHGYLQIDSMRKTEH